MIIMTTKEAKKKLETKESSRTPRIHWEFYANLSNPKICSPLSMAMSIYSSCFFFLNNERNVQVQCVKFDKPLISNASLALKLRQMTLIWRQALLGGQLQSIKTILGHSKARTLSIKLARPVNLNLLFTWLIWLIKQAWTINC